MALGSFGVDMCAYAIARALCYMPHCVSGAGTPWCCEWRCGGAGVRPTPWLAAAARLGVHAGPRDRLHHPSHAAAPLGAVSGQTKRVYVSCCMHTCLRGPGAHSTEHRKARPSVPSPPPPVHRNEVMKSAGKIAPMHQPSTPAPASACKSAKSKSTHKPYLLPPRLAIRCLNSAALRARRRLRS